MVTFVLLLSYAFTVLAAGGKLGISQDVTGNGFFHWSSVAVYSEDTAKLFPEDKDIAAVAKAAYKELMVDLNDERDEPLADTHKPYTKAAWPSEKRSISLRRCKALRSVNRWSK